MEKIYSKIEPKKLLHTICRKKEITSRREEFAGANEVIQAATIMLKKDEQVPAHRHLENARTTSTTQEFVCVIEGELMAEFYDIDGSFIERAILKEGDCYVSYGGGHGIKSLKDNTKLYEIKNGPYPGKERDKAGIEGQ
ncbi:WbuC family cupin fold metalloprotein [Candidatus Pacearchaeota archaeon]|nr:WbuC family cupin fold metalloprotein [Candidatus Pacearchaeota archaeon]